jgi:hypothetical protein
MSPTISKVAISSLSSTYQSSLVISDCCLMGIEETSQMLKVAFQGFNGKKDDYTPYLGYGHNSVQHVVANKWNQKEATLHIYK